MAVHFTQAATTVRYSGEIRARYETPMAFQVGGKIDRRWVDVGTPVRKGQILASLEPTDFRLAVAEAKAHVRAVEAELSQSLLDLKHLRALRDQALSSPAAVERRQAAVRVAEAHLAEARSALALEERRLGYAELRAGQDGVVTAVERESGQVVESGEEVLRLAREEEKEVVIAVPENRLAEVQGAAAIRVSLWARPDEFLPGRIREVSPGVDPVTRTFTARISLPTAGEDVRWGLTATVHVDRFDSLPTAVLPMTAVTEESGQARVWVLHAADRSVHSRPVVIAGYDTDQAKVVKGLSEGEQVVAAGVHKLLEGQRVRVPDTD